MIYRENTRRQPKLIAHRGYAVLFPENSRAAFRKAGELGFWAIETDVRETVDGVLVCCHDATVDRTFLGTGAVAEMSWDCLSRLSFRGRDGVPFEGERGLPTFTEYLQICRDYGSLPFIESKCNNIPRILEEACRFFPEEQIVLSSVVLEHLMKAREVSDKVFLHHIFSDPAQFFQLARKGPAGISLKYSDPADFPEYLVRMTHEAGLLMCLRAGDTVEAVHKMIDLGLDYIPTNRIAPGAVSGSAMEGADLL